MTVQNVFASSWKASAKQGYWSWICTLMWPNLQMEVWIADIWMLFNDTGGTCTNLHINSTLQKGWTFNKTLYGRRFFLLEFFSLLLWVSPAQVSLVSLISSRKAHNKAVSCRDGCSWWCWGWSWFMVSSVNKLDLLTPWQWNASVPPAT